MTTILYVCWFYLQWISWIIRMPWYLTTLRWHREMLLHGKIEYEDEEEKKNASSEFIAQLLNIYI